MDDTSHDDKPFEPSQKKLDDARARGELARSPDLVTAISYGGFYLVCLSVGYGALIGFADALIVMIDQPVDLAAMAFAGGGAAFGGGLLVSTINSTLVWFVGPGLCAIIALFAMRGLVFAPDKIAPKLNRISPVDGFKNKFGRQGFFEFFKSTAKLVIYAVILALFLVLQIDTIIGSMHLQPALVTAILVDMLADLMGIVCLVALLLGTVDFLWQLAEHRRKNRMTRTEMMDELKQSDGDPQMRQQRRRRGQEIAMNRMLADVPQADVVIVNPLHYAVALKWDRGSGTAPVCVAKGVDEIAAKIRELALDHAVPIHPDPPTARALHASVQIGDQITPAHYQAVATAIRFAEAMRKKARQG